MVDLRLFFARGDKRRSRARRMRELSERLPCLPFQSDLKIKN